MYEMRSRVRYSETDADARLSLVGIMNYMQDCSTQQSEDIGAGLEWLRRERRVWLLSSWQILVLKRPALGEEIRVRTWPYAFKGIYGLRNFAIYDADGDYAAKANSCWFLVDADTGKPVRVTEAIAAPYGELEPKLPMEYAPRKIELPGGLTDAGMRPVMRHQIDTNRHVNNAQYVDMARELLPEGIRICEIRAEYRKAAVLGDTLHMRYAETAGGYFVSICKEDGSIFANVALQTLPEK
ncbi:acyl-[acyl-carrier-protein] thioesterase [bacterium 1XD42-94]|nr:acyl-[acyl-carrier-protein] thioesterase [bacterium 1XD42-76]NBK05432.1 acyl-[acyl-carrier-protein] thioesterase [bacterium 1XD42-94]